MIECRDGVFFLQTARTSYWFARTSRGHLEHIHYGPRLQPQDPAALRWKRTTMPGSAIAYDDDVTYSLDTIPLEFSSPGRGDYRHSPLRVRSGTGYDVDLTYAAHRTLPGPAPCATLPVADGGEEDCVSLIVTLADEVARIEVDLVYTVYAAADVIARRTVVRNTGPAGGAAVELTEAMSLQLDLPDRGYELTSFAGGWIKEAHARTRPVGPGSLVIGSTTGASSHRHNPGFLLTEAGTGEDHGAAYGVNLIYSGNHRSTIEADSRGLVRITTGIHPATFTWPLEPGEEFETPQAVLTFSADGKGGVSENFHRFVNCHVLPARYRAAPRPIVFNSWEAVGFDVGEKRLGRLAERAAGLGMELFVIDDGWFTGRRDDTGGLGDYEVDQRKFPSGLPAFVRRVNDLGMAAGIWVEPEMVSERSRLFRDHPEWAMAVPGKTPLRGRHQLVLDLCNPDVCDDIVDRVGALLDSANFTYVKWDMNRHISDAWSEHVAHPGMVAHTYIQNLYSVLERIFAPRPHVLLETCSSGGNRFDLGMLRYSAMIWASDDTDPIERLEIQQGLSHLYPQSVISAHVSAAPHEQTLRNTPLSTRFNVAAFGCLGYEYDLDLLTREERKEIAEQIAFYSAHRELLQFGTFRRLPTASADTFRWQVSEPGPAPEAGAIAVVGNFQRRIPAAPVPDQLAIPGLDPGAQYRVRSKPQRLPLERFGHLVKHVAPMRLDPRGVVLGAVNRVHSLRDAAEEYTGTGALLAAGVRLEHQFQGTYYNPRTRLLGDYGSTLYVVTLEGTP